ncbi:DUF3488 and transglutaminase-like domain-containing protein [Niveibacterium sp. SC-1]|uniref:transglutaminase TgpA family protein n=1 Tax=Niveibacterium sp. SC-1 TaxID=3135646 RepID=UPI00311E3D88
MIANEDRSATQWITAAVAITLLPLLPALTLPLAAFALVPLIWQAWRLWRRPAAMPPRPVLLLLAVGAAAATGLQYGSMFGRLPGLAVLAVLVGLKLLESRTRRDAHVAVQLCFFLQLGYFLIEQSALTAVLAACSCLLCIAALLRVEQHGLSLRRALSGSGRLLLWAAPLAAALFVLFPRLDRPLWGLPADAFSASSGLSDTMSPGSISELSLSGEIAFRVEFGEHLPPPATRYFRGPVLTFFDGRSWRPGPPSGARIATVRPTTDYVVTLEPNQQRWLLGLEQPVPAPDQILTAEGVLMAREPIRSRVRLHLQSHPGDRLVTEETEAHLRAARALPQGFNPRALALGRQIADQNVSDPARLEAIKDFLRRGDFAYTLSPPLLGRDTADDFLFKTRHGFCEHFASAFVVLARAAGLPARVVAGYQGGELNAVDRTLVVRQSDAHAWAEVWLGDAWQRVDPTAIAAPRRIDGGLLEALPDTDALPYLVRTDSAWMRALRDRAEAVAHAWNTWVLGYDAQRQRSFMQQLGFSVDDWRTVIYLLGGAAILWQGLILAPHFVRLQRRPRAERAWRRVQKRLARHGIEQGSGEGAISFAARAGALDSRLGTGLDSLAAAYSRLCFGPSPDEAALRSFERQISSWLSAPSSTS